MDESLIIDQVLLFWLEQYKIIREEVKTALSHQQNILNWSSVAIGVLLVFGANLWNISPLLTLGLFVIVFPTISIMFLNIWLSEVTRMIRASNYLLLIEDKLKGRLPPDKLSLFEHWIREEDLKGKNKYHMFGYKATIVIYLGIIAGSTLAANAIVWSNRDLWIFSFSFWNKIIFLSLSVVFIFFLIFIVRKQINRCVPNI